MKIGAFTGKFYPAHIGHVWAVDYSLKYCDKVIIVISSNPIRNQEIKEKCGFDILDASIIKSWFEEYYKNDSRVEVAIIDESGLKPYPNSTDDWVARFKKQFPSVNVKIADESYREFNQKHFPECEFLAVPRDVVSIHSTDIRNNLNKYFDYLIPTAKPYFLNKIN